jgi:uncharacterized protein YcbX
VRLVEIRVYPVKSLRGDRPDVSPVEKRGLAGDRHWMVVDAVGRFITQREMPAMALVSARRSEHGTLRLVASGHAGLVVSPPVPGGPTRAVSVWRDTVRALAAPPEADAWLSAVLGVACHLVFQPPQAARTVNPDYGAPGDEVSFADAYPVLLANAASLADLNARLATPVEMVRFRPNLVVEGAAAWAEDCWRLIRIGGVTFRVVKPCDRCVMTTVDPHTGTRPDKTEPLRTLGRFRRDPRGVMFGQNIVPQDLGTLREGDPVEILETGPPNLSLEQETISQS